MSQSEMQADRLPRSRPRPGPSAGADLASRLTALGHDPEAVVGLLADACASAAADVVLILVVGPGGRLTPVAVRHADAAVADDLRDRLVGERPAAWIMAGAGRDPSSRSLPVDPQALPEDVREILAEQGAESVVIAPVPGHSSPIGLVVAARRAGSPPFGDHDREDIVTAGRMCGTALDLARLVAEARRQAALVDLIGDAVVAIDLDLVVTTWNQGAERIYGYSAEESVGRPFSDLVETTYRDSDPAAARAAVARTGSWRGRVTQTTKSGRQVEIDSRVTSVLDEHGRPGGLVAVNRDLTDLIAMQASADLQSRFAQELMDALDSRGAVLDAAGRVVAANARWRAATADRNRCECGPVPEGENWLEALRASSWPEAVSLTGQVDVLLRGQRSGAQAECRCPSAGAERVTAIEVVRVDAGQGGAIVVQSDITWRRRLQDELSFRATHDELTGLPNRAALMEVLSTSLERLDGTRKLAVLFCDLDGFKDINDGLGHAVGDQVLVAVARRLRRRCRSADVVARFGGDEFVVVLSLDDVDQAVAMADRVVEVLAEPIVVGDAEVAPGVSVGITVVDAPPEGDDPVGTLLRDADTAMYHAKGRGRGRYEFFDVRLRENIAERLELAAALHRAVSDDELEIRYQTRRHCGDRAIVGVEALLDWRHPALGSVEPGVFIPIAERTGRIVEVGGWVLRRALAQCASLPDRRISVAVNVSPRQLSGPRLTHTVASALEESGLDPGRLVLEITESAFVDDPVQARAVLTELRGLGVAIALDDFGTGWSSLSYLRTLPVDVLKIDRSFVADLPTDPDACAVVAAVLGLGHGMGLQVVAEGVETEDQLAVLRDMGCDDYQGFIDGLPGPLGSVLAVPAP